MHQRRVPETRKIEAGEGLGGLGSDLAMKILLPAIFADFGQPRIVQNLGQMTQDGCKLQPRWRQDAPG